MKKTIVKLGTITFLVSATAGSVYLMTNSIANNGSTENTDSVYALKSNVVTGVPGGQRTPSPAHYGSETIVTTQQVDTDGDGNADAMQQIWTYPDGRVVVKTTEQTPGEQHVETRIVPSGKIVEDPTTGKWVVVENKTQSGLLWIGIAGISLASGGLLVVGWIIFKRKSNERQAMILRKQRELEELDRM